MKQIHAFLFIFIAFTTFAQTVVPAGNVQGNWTAANSPYIIQGNITVPFGQSLNIEPNVNVVFEGLYNISVYGILDAEGSANQPIIFRAQDTTGWYLDSLPIGGWQGIYFNSAPPIDSSILSYCYFKDTKWGGVATNQGIGWFRSLHVSHCKFFHNLRTNSSFGRLIQASFMSEIDYCEIYDNDIALSVLTVYSSYLHHNKIHHNKGGNIILATYCNLLFAENEVYENISRQDFTTTIGLNNSIDSKIYHNKIHHNTTRTLAAIKCNSGKVDIDGNLICNNQHTSGDCLYTDGGGGIHLATNGDSISNRESFFIVRNNVIANNYSPYAGGAIYLLSATAKIMNNHIINNSTIGGLSVIYAAAAFAYSPSRLDIQNNIFYGNVKNITIYQVDTFRFKYNCLETFLSQQSQIAIVTVIDTTNNVISANPLMIAPTISSLLSDDATIADFNLQSNSVCINAGNPDTTNCYISSLDYANNNRIIGNVDIGAFEQKSIEGISDWASFNSSLHIYPNPVQQTIHVILPDRQGTLSLYDITGKELLFLNNINTIEMDIVLPTLSGGLYFMVWVKNGKQVVDKFWVE